METLPKVIVVLIFNFAEWEDYRKFVLVCKNWKKLVESNWINRYKIEMKILNKDPNKEISQEQAKNECLSLKVNFIKVHQIFKSLKSIKYLKLGWAVQRWVFDQRGRFNQSLVKKIFCNQRIFFVLFQI